MGFKILAINPGSTSTKVALYDEERPSLDLTLRHTAEQIARYTNIIDQLGWRREMILTALSEHGFDIMQLSAVIGRGGLVRPIPAGVYEVNEAMRRDLTNATMEHASNLGGLLAAEIAALNLTGVGAYDLYFGMFQFNLYGVFSVITVLLVILFGLDVGPMYKAEKLAIETGKTYSDTDNLIATPPETDFAEDCKLSMANFLAPMITLILTIFAVVFYTGQIWVNGFIGCFGHANIQMAIAMCFLTGSIAAGIVGIKSKLITLGGAIDKWTKGAASMMQVIMILVCAWSISGLTKSMNIGQFLTGVVQDSIPAALIPAILFLIGVVVSFATGSSWGVWALGMPIALPMANAMGIPLTLAIGAVVSGGLFGDHCSPISDTTIMASAGAHCFHLNHVATQIPYGVTVAAVSFVSFIIAGLVQNVVVCMIIAIALMIGTLLVIKAVTAKKHKGIFQEMAAADKALYNK